MNSYTIFVKGNGAVFDFFVCGNSRNSGGDEQQCDSGGYYQQVL